MAKIFSQAGTISPIGGLIGVMVEEEEDIANVDLSQIQADAASSPAAAEQSATSASEPQ